MAEIDNEELLTLTADIVAAHVGHNSISISDLPALIASVHGALSKLGTPAELPAEPLQPAVSIRSSVKPDYIICLEDGKKLTMLKRHLRTAYDLTPDQYRAKWNLPADYPMVAPNYAAKRRELAKSIGLGRKPRVADTPTAAAPKSRSPRQTKGAVIAAPVAVEAPKRRGRPKAVVIPTPVAIPSE